MDYAITFTLNPHMYKLLPEDQFEAGKGMLSSLFSSYKKTIVAEFTKSYNIHFHGIIYSKTKRELYDKIRKNKILGFICLKQIESYEDWIEYIVKDTSKTYKELICKYPVIFNDYSVPYKLIDDDPIAKSFDEINSTFTNLVKVLHKKVTDASLATANGANDANIPEGEN